MAVTVPVPWARYSLRPGEFSCDYLPRTMSGGPSFTGFTQDTSVDTGIWQIRYGKIPIVTAADLMLFRSYALQINGRANQVLVPIYSNKTAPWASGVKNSSISAKVIGSTAIRAVSIVIEMDTGGTVYAGQFFTIANRLYGIANISATAVVGGKTQYTCDILPPLRAAAADNAAVSFDSLISTCKLLTDTEMSARLTPGEFTYADVNFIEDF